MTTTKKPERSYRNIDELIMALQTRYSFDPDKYSISSRVYGGHFFVFQDKDEHGRVNGKAHLICVPGRVDWIHVFESYDRELVEQVAEYLTNEGPFTNVDIQIVNEHNRIHGNSSYFCKKNMRGFGTLVLPTLYAGRFFITHDREKQMFSRNQKTYHHYRVVFTDDNCEHIEALQSISDSFDTLTQAKSFIKRITRYVKPRTTPTQYEEYCERVNAAQGIGTPEAVQAVIDDAVAAHKLCYEVDTIELQGE